MKSKPQLLALLAYRLSELRVVLSRLNGINKRLTKRFPELNTATLAIPHPDVAHSMLTLVCELKERVKEGAA